MGPGRGSSASWQGRCRTWTLHRTCWLMTRHGLRGAPSPTTAGKSSDGSWRSMTERLLRDSATGSPRCRISAFVQLRVVRYGPTLVCLLHWFVRRSLRFGQGCIRAGMQLWSNLFNDQVLQIWPSSGSLQLCCMLYCEDDSCWVVWAAATSSRMSYQEGRRGRAFPGHLHSEIL